MIYFTSDTHFCHASIITLCNRPFKDYNEMQRSLIRNWNAVVGKQDDIYILGDFIHKGDGEAANQLLKKLNGKKYLILGNHDKYVDDIHFDPGAFEWIRDYYVLNYKKRKFILFHYPILEWAGFYGDAIHLYGHVHNGSKDETQQERLKILGTHAFNVGTDVNFYTPVCIETILGRV